MKTRPTTLGVYLDSESNPSPQLIAGTREIVSDWRSLATREGISAADRQLIFSLSLQGEGRGEGNFK